MNVFAYALDIRPNIGSGWPCPSSAAAALWPAATSGI